MSGASGTVSVANNFYLYILFEIQIICLHYNNIAWSSSLEVIHLLLGYLLSHINIQVIGTTELCRSQSNFVIFNIKSKSRNEKQSQKVLKILTSDTMKINVKLRLIMVIKGVYLLKETATLCFK